jgi:hypothetical protein
MHKYVRKCPHAVSVFLAVFAQYMLMQSFSCQFTIVSCIKSDIKWPTTTLSFGALQNLQRSDLSESLHSGALATHAIKTNAWSERTLKS